MKKIGIATILALDNFGALLQAYALQRKLTLMGYDAELIDFREKNQSDCSMFVKIKSIKDILRNVRKLLRYSDYKERMTLFSNFVEKNIKLSSNYPNENELGSVRWDYDVLCTGSDQTFNLKLPVFKKAYYLNFTDDIPKISYAPSFGEQSSQFSEEQRKWIKEQLLKYKSLSVREKQGVELAESITGRNDVFQALDPTLLLTEENWTSVVGENKENSEDYILFYSVLSDQWVVDEVKRISEKTGMRVIAVHLQNQFELGVNFARYLKTGPAEFLSLIKNAKLVLTTSFHATVFSVVFKKPFYSFLLGEGNRIGSLLELLHLKEREIIKDKKIEINYDVDYKKANEVLETERRKCEEYLKKAIEDM